eukprot:scaffold64282_cov63-Phaeocystis_antarctica.AAC.1
MLSADRRGHRNYSNVYWKRAPPAEANTDTSDFFIKIRSGFHFVITDREDRGACLPGTVIYESPASKYNIEHPFAGGYPAPPPPSLPTSSPPPPPCVDSFPSFCSNTPLPGDLRVVLCSTNVAATAAAVAPSLAAALAAAAKRSTMSGPAGDAKLQVIDGVRSMQPDPGVLCRDLWSMHAVVALAAAAEPFAAAAAVSVAAAA